MAIQRQTASKEDLAKQYAEGGTGSYVKTPVGVFKCKLTQCVADKSFKKQKPQLKLSFEVIEEIECEETEVVGTKFDWMFTEIAKTQKNAEKWESAQCAEIQILAEELGIDIDKLFDEEDMDFPYLYANFAGLALKLKSRNKANDIMVRRVQGSGEYINCQIFVPSEEPAFLKEDAKGDDY